MYMMCGWIFLSYCGWYVRLAYGRMDEWWIGECAGLMNKWMGGLVDEWMNGWIDF
jgi:hypothetical protein